MFNTEMVIDIGSSYTTIYEKNKGIVLKEPSLVALRQVRNKLKPVAVGIDAARLFASNEVPADVFSVYPFSKGAVIDEQAASIMTKVFLETVVSGKLIRPSIDVIATVSCGLSIVERNAIERIFTSIGIKSVTLVESPLAIANLVDYSICTVVIIGSHLSEIAVVGQNGIISGCSVDIAGAKMDEAIKKYVASVYKVSISSEKAAGLREGLGSLSDKQQNTMEVTGQSITDDSIKRIDVTAEDIRIAVMDTFKKLLTVIQSVISLLPKGVSGADDNIVIAGGVAKTHGLGEYFRQGLGKKVSVITDSNAVAAGAAEFFANKGKLMKMLGVTTEEKL